MGGEIKPKVDVQLDEKTKKVLDSLNTNIKGMKDETFSKIDTVESNLSTKIADTENNFKSIEEKVNLLSVSENKPRDGKAGFKNHIEFFNAVIQAGMNENRPDKMLDKLRPFYNTVGSDEAKVSNNPDGGFTLPESFLPGLLTTDPQSLQADTGNMTRKIPMQNSVVRVNARVDKDHSSSVSGGFQLYWREEAATVTATKSKFEQIRLEANSLMGLSYASEEILSQSPMSFAALIQNGFGDEKISKLNGARLRGTGVGQFTGVLNAPATISIAKESGQAATTINGTNILKMRARAWRYNQAIWMANADTYLQLTNAHITGTNGDVFLFRPGNGVDVPDTLLGRPIIFDENMSTLGTVGDIGIFNWNEYLEGMLGGSSFMESIHVRFIYNERAFKFVVYTDGAPWWSTALTPKNGATLSPFITLATRA